MKFVSKNIYNILFLASLLFLSCQKQSEISKNFNCETSVFNNLETVDDVKDLFSLDIPENWKTNLYQDEVQSSIFTADTTKQLTETMLLDVTFIQNKIAFNDAFILQQEQENLAKGLIKTKSKQILLLEKSSLYLYFKGKKGKFNYQVCNIFIKVNESNFVLAKAEVYGDSLVNNRFCEAFSLIENIKLKK
ncbi:hypothetical protein [Polaribacter reichenbachii]|uniref:hypothetical protein n=1 Tax=Polaribacter reichenbachii TaxID=996801 RepID=UPI00111238B1|nr:hypothetical protein [Polaribacter reichenbachii]